MNSSYVNSIISSLEVTNEQPIVGVVTYPSTGEVKQRIFDTFPTQNRAVTQADYENIAYRMHSKYGAIKRVSVQRDPDSQKRNLNMYVVSEDTNGKLIAANSTIKNNLKTWINNYRMINDTVDILDPYILNFGVEFIIKPKAATEKYTALDDCIEALKTHFSTPFFIGEPIYISQIYEILKGVSGVLDVTKVKVVGKNSGNYSSAAIDISDNLSSDGSYVVVPKNAILELKYPETDIIGKVR